MQLFVRKHNFEIVNVIEQGASRPSLNLSARSELLDGHMKNIISDLDDHKKCRSSELTQEDKYSECTHTTLTATSKLSGMYFLVMLQFMWNNYGPQTTPTILFYINQCHKVEHTG